MYKEKARGISGFLVIIRGREKLQLFADSSSYLRKLIGREF